MANLRVVHSNAADRAVLITATTSAGGLVASNLLTDIKSEVWRSTSAAAQDITLEWSSAETVKMVAFPFASLTTSATMRIRGYVNATDLEGAHAFDSGTVAACPADSSYEWGTTELGANTYGFGGAKCAVAWFTGGSFEKIIVTLNDPTNPSEFIEAGRLVCGDYWEPSINCEYGAQISAGDMSKHERDSAGNLRTDRGPRYKAVVVDCSLMPAADRNVLWRIMYGNGMSRPVFFSLSPDAADSDEEAMFNLYGKLTKVAAIKYQFYNQFNTTLEIEEV